MGEDETLPRNRISLICQNCRLVNGLAPPGTKHLSDLGKWRCIGCHALNGEDDEATKVVQEMKERIETQSEEDKQPLSPAEEKSSSESVILIDEDNEEDDEVHEDSVGTGEDSPVKQ